MRLMIPQRVLTACFIRMPRKLNASTSLQVRMMASAEPASGKPAATPNKSAQKHNPQPTESEADVAADRSRNDPIHRQNPTESQEDVVADRSPDNPLSKAFTSNVGGKVVGSESSRLGK
ncbi:hypothetical protein CEP52_011686 [Fusarium oligoseptatum]|uniref:Uncharacterized protein n=1 Tax=Fusarium oligoseptatum TaxID=2604345 RepID=A0A428T2B4_9HYPO|nr:hypothetical protein CEP52_011686 [Fusarium oligoseptatum]